MMHMEQDTYTKREGGGSFSHKRASSGRKILQSNSQRALEDNVIVPYTRQKVCKSTRLATLVRSLLKVLPIPIACKWMGMETPSTQENKHSDLWKKKDRSLSCLGNRVTGTLFGHRKGHVHFVVQEEPGSEPVLLLELSTPTNLLVKEMSSGLVRIALECERENNGNGSSSSKAKMLLHEPLWTMYCNGRKTGYALSRNCSESDSKLLGMVKSVSMGAGVLPSSCIGNPNPFSGEGELMYMRATFERVVGSRDSEAFYMLNPDGHGGPELSIFLLRI